MTRTFRRHSMIACTACVMATAIATEAPAQSPPEYVVEQDLLYVLGETSGSESARESGRYWIGVQVNPVEGALQSQLGLSDGGLLVSEVVPDAPAAKAGVKQHDILLSMNGSLLSDVKDLLDAVQKVEEQEATLKLLREGKKQSVTITPVERTHRLTVAAPDNAWVDLRVIHPYAIQLGRNIKFPDDLRITIRKSGNEPAEIIVRRGDDEWEVTERTLDKLPEDVRQYVQQFLGPRLIRSGESGVELRPLAAVRPPGASGRMPARTVLPRQPQSLEGRLDEITRRLEAIERALKNPER